MAGKNILIVCAGNICRSPMAEAMFARRLTAYNVMSAGIIAEDGRRAATNAQKVMVEHGYDISGHRSMHLQDWMLLKAELIFVMDQEQQRYIERNYKALKGRVFRLAQHQNADVLDPVGKDEAFFSKTYDVLDICSSVWADLLSENNDVNDG